MTSLDEVHLLYAGLVRDHCLGWLVDSAVEVDDQLIDESSLALLEEMRERSLELFELKRLQNKLSLHSWRH